MSSMWGLTQFGNIEFEFADSVLKVSEDTYGDEGTLLPFLIESFRFLNLSKKETDCLQIH